MSEKPMAQRGTKEWHEQIVAAVAQAYRTEVSLEKTMDTAFASAIVSNIENLLRTDKWPKLGCATTRSLIEELMARLDIDMDYRTIDS